MRWVPACAAALYRMPLVLVQGGAPPTSIRELPMRHKYRRPLRDQPAVRQLDLFGLLSAKHPHPLFKKATAAGGGPPGDHRADDSPPRRPPSWRSSAQLDG